MFVRKRPLFSLCFSFTVSYFVISRLNDTFAVCLAGALALIPLLFIIQRFIPHLYKNSMLYALTVILMGLGLSGIGCHARNKLWREPILSHIGSEAKIVAQVDKECYNTAYSSSYFITLKSINGNPTDIRMVLSLDEPADIRTSDIISGTAQLSIPAEKSGLFPLRDYYASEAIIVSGEAVSEFKCEEGNPTLPMRFEKTAAHLSEKLNILLGDASGSLASGILFGKKDSLDEAVKRDFSVLGISHVLAVSGLHISVLIGLLEYILKYFGVGKWGRLIINTAAMLLLFFLTGMSLSCLRAEIMMFFVLLSSCIDDARSDGLTSLFFASSVILILFRGAAWDTGFMLSISATAGIITLGKALTEKIKKKFSNEGIPKEIIGRLLSAVSISVSAMVFTLPVLWYSFGEVSLAAPLSNIIFIPLITVMLYGTLIVLLFSGTVLCDGVTFIVQKLGEGILNSASALRSILPDTVSLNTGFITAVLIITITFVFFALMLSRKRRLLSIILAPSVLFTSVFGTGCVYVMAESGRAAEIYAVSRLKNDFLLINSQGKTILCDISDGTKTSLRAAADISPLVYSDTSVDALYITHLHTKHISSIKDMADRYHLKRIYLPKDGDCDIILSLKEELDSRRIEVIYYSAEEEIRLYGISLRRSRQDMLSRSTQPIFYISISFSDKRILYSEAAVFESDLLNDFVNEIENSKAVILGIHGPKVKKTMGTEELNALRQRKVFVTSNEVNETLGTMFKTIEVFSEYHDEKRVFAQNIGV